MYSYIKQIERLLKFVKGVYDQGHLDWCDASNPHNQCLACKAYDLLYDDEPIRLTYGPPGRLMGTGEGYEQPVRTLENPTNRASTYYLGQCE